MSSKPLPRALVFDLDGCVWFPEMYMILGTRGSPFKERPDGNLDTDDGKATVELLGDTRDIMLELATHDKWKGTAMAVASRSNEPNWASECIDKFPLLGGTDLRLKDALRGPREIYQALKSAQLKTIAGKTGVDLNDMVFFDNEPGNCRDVAAAGATVCYVPNGLNREDFNMVLEAYPAPGTIIGKEKA